MQADSHVTRIAVESRRFLEGAEEKLLEEIRSFVKTAKVHPTSARLVDQEIYENSVLMFQEAVIRSASKGGGVAKDNWAETLESCFIRACFEVFFATCDSHLKSTTWSRTAGRISEENVAQQTWLRYYPEFETLFRTRRFDAMRPLLFTIRRFAETDEIRNRFGRSRPGKPSRPTFVSIEDAAVPEPLEDSHEAVEEQKIDQRRFWETLSEAEQDALLSKWRDEELNIEQKKARRRALYQLKNYIQDPTGFIAVKSRRGEAS
ncbi:MAG: hypothetical protein DIJKHBIC_00830 [Thermoanaerobaculia bacterium]|nr:hypothetical protein [Thermoanaerobaculia bacterium]